MACLELKLSHCIKQAGTGFGLFYITFFAIKQILSLKNYGIAH